MSEENVEEDLTKKVLLFLKRNDTAPLNCTVGYMSREMGKPSIQVHEVIEDLVDEGIVGPWSEWQKGVITPYKITDLPKLIDKGTDFTYDEIELLTSAYGGYRGEEPALLVLSGVNTPDHEKSFIISQWGRENLEKMSRKFRFLELSDKVKPPLLRGVAEDDLIIDTEIGYLNNFFKSIFFREDFDHYFALYASEGEDLPTFRKRTLKSLLENLIEISGTLLEKQESPDISDDRKLSAPYLFFFAFILDRYVQLGKKVGIQTSEVKKLIDLRKKILKAGEKLS